MLRGVRRGGAIPFDFFTDSGNVNPGEKKKMLAKASKPPLRYSRYQRVFLRSFRFGQVFMVRSIHSDTRLTLEHLASVGT